MRPLAFAAAVACTVPASSALAQAVADPNAFATGAPADAARPLAIGRLLVQLEVVPSCVFTTGTDQAASPVRCTRGVRYRAAILDDADAAFATTQAFAPPRMPSVELVRIQAQRLNVEF